MPNLIQITDFANKFSDNLFTKNTIFDDSTILNTTAGSGYLTGFLNDAYYGHFIAPICTSYNSVDFSFNVGDSLKVPIFKDGNYLFQMSIFSLQPDSPAFNFGVLVYQDGVYSETINGTAVTNPAINGGFMFSFAQNIDCFGITELDFSFVIYKDLTYPSANLNFKFGNFKLEYDKKALGVPTPYSLPIDYTIPNAYTGWAYYVDSLVTPTITIGTTYTQISIDALGATINDYLPLEIRGTSELWDLSKITPIAIGDDYDGRFDVTITAKTGSPTAIELIIDISGGVAGTNKAFTGWLQAIGTAPYDQSLPLDFFTLATFKANGGKIYARTDTGTVTIGRRNIKISRKSKAF